MNLESINPERYHKEISALRPGKMQKTKKVRSIFVELRKSTNGEASDQFLIESAASLIDLYDVGQRPTKMPIALSRARSKSRPDDDSLPCPLIGKTLPRSLSMDRWTTDCTAPDLRWITYTDLDLPEDDDMSDGCGRALKELMENY